MVTGQDHEELHEEELFSMKLDTAYRQGLAEEKFSIEMMLGLLRSDNHDKTYLNIRS